MHILFYSPGWPIGRSANGIVTYVHTISEALRDLGHRVTIITNSEVHCLSGTARRAAAPKGGHLRARWDHRIDSLLRYPRSAGRRLRERIKAVHRDTPIDVIEMEETFGWIGELVGLGPKVVARLHGPAVQSAGWLAGERSRGLRKREAAERRALLRVDGLTAPAEATLARVFEAYAPRHAAAVIPNPVPLPPPRPAGMADRRILWVGKITWAKGVDLALDAFARLAEVDPEVQLDLVGPEGELGPGGETLTAASLLEGLSHDTRARIVVHGRRTPQEIADLRARSMLTWITSRSEVFPYAFFEAAAAGHAALSTRWPGCDSVIRDGVTGRVVDIDPGAIAGATQALLSDPAQLERFGRAARDHVEQHLSPEAVARQTVAFYSSLMSGEEA